MDWQQPTDDRRVVLAIARIRATDKSDYRGPVIFNPGVSGIAQMLQPVIPDI